MALRLAAEGVEIVDRAGAGWPARARSGGRQRIQAGAVLIATGALPRVLPGAEPDGERILTWRQLYDLPELPPELIVVGSGVTGAEFASAYQALGSQVTLVSSRDRVLPHEDADAAVVVEDVFRRRGMTVLGRSRAAAVKRTGDGVRGHPGGRPDGARLALPAHRGHGARHPRSGPGRGRGHPGRPGVRPGGPGVPDHGAGACTRPVTAPAC